MFGNYLRSALRILRKQKSYAAISIFSLVVGMTCFILLMLFTRYELGYDSFHRNADRIYLVGQVVPDWNVMGTNRMSSTSGPLGPALEREFPGVEHAVRTWPTEAPLGHERKSVLARGLFADRAFFEMFSFPMVLGNPSSALADPFSVVLTESTAKRLFGPEDPIGRAVIHGGGREYRVTGIMKDPPPNSHLAFDYLLSFVTVGSLRDDLDTSWSILNYLNYVELRKGADPAAFEAGLQSVIRTHHPARDQKRAYFLMPLRSLHHETGVYIPYWRTVDRTFIRLLMAVAGLILAVACVNYVNLATARATARGREVGVRKTFGAGRRQLVAQFMGEAGILAAMSLLLSLVLVQALLPIFNSLTGIRLPAGTLAEPSAWPWILGLGIAVGLLSGAYPALVLSSMKPANVFRSAFGAREGGRRLVLRNALVVFQFFATLTLVAGTLIIRKQLDYIRTADVGYDRKNVLALRLWEQDSRTRYREIETELLRNPDVRAAAVCNVAPVRATQMNNFMVESESGEMVEVPQITNYFVDSSYFDLFGLTLVAGRSFSPDAVGDVQNQAVINETAARMAGLTDPIGKRIGRGNGEPLRIIGVVKDIHYTSFRSKVGPLMFLYRPERTSWLFVKTSGHRTQETIAFIESTIRRQVPDFSYDYTAMEDIYDRLYESEDRLGGLLTGFAVVAILVASVGLFGLISFVIDRKRKEIGIRKVLGATVAGIMGLIARDLFVLIGVAGLLALPVSYAFGRRWLQGFYYRTGLGAGVFAAAVAVVLAIALLCIARITTRAARESPSVSLKNI
jgi:putative ABC transport system permease protein